MFHKVLLPIDLSAPESWSRALPAALEVLSPEGELHVVTVMPDLGMSVIGTYFESGFEQRALQELAEQLADWTTGKVPAGIEAVPHVLHGTVYDQIILAADRLDVDAIVMGSHRPELKDYLLGPNAARVVRHAKQSVFVVRGA